MQSMLGAQANMQRPYLQTGMAIVPFASLYWQQDNGAKESHHVDTCFMRNVSRCGYNLTQHVPSAELKQYIPTLYFCKVIWNPSLALKIIWLFIIWLLQVWMHLSRWKSSSEPHRPYHSIGICRRWAKHATHVVAELPVQNAHNSSPHQVLLLINKHPCYRW